MYTCPYTWCRTEGFVPCLGTSHGLSARSCAGFCVVPVQHPISPAPSAFGMCRNYCTLYNSFGVIALHENVEKEKKKKKGWCLGKQRGSWHLTAHAHRGATEPSSKGFNYLRPKLPRQTSVHLQLETHQQIAY